jgi:hypothetical protein
MIGEIENMRETMEGKNSLQIVGPLGFDYY